MESYLVVMNGDVSAILDGDSKKNYSIRYHCIPTKISLRSLAVRLFGFLSSSKALKRVARGSRASGEAAD